MQGLKKLLEEEISKLSIICARIEDNLEKAPKGHLRIAMNKGVAQYYYKRPGDTSGGVYLPKVKMELIRELAQKTYEEKALKSIRRQIKLLERFIRGYEDNVLEKIYWQEQPNRRRLLCPVEAIWEYQLEEWIQTPYQGKEFREQSPLIQTENGLRVRSKTEKSIAEYLDRMKIPYKYEKPLYLKGYGTVYPDFTFFSKRLGCEIYWEHEGIMDDPDYSRNAIKKIATYENNGYIIGERLILTFETKDTVLNTNDIIRIVNQYLM